MRSPLCGSSRPVCAPRAFHVSFSSIEEMAGLFGSLARRLPFHHDNDHGSILAGEAAAIALATNPGWLIGRA